MTLKYFKNIFKRDSYTHEHSTFEDVEPAVVGVAEVPGEVGRVGVLRPQPLHDLARLEDKKAIQKTFSHLLIRVEI